MHSIPRDQRFVVTGGAGFIGSNFLRHMISKYLSYFFLNIDKLTYAGALSTIREFEKFPQYKFIKADICDSSLMHSLIKKGDIIVNFAAESHVDNSINEPEAFIRTNVVGTHILLEASRKNNAKLFVQISTDEVYGSLDFDAPSSIETDLLKPSSPYSASKAAAECLCIGNIKTFNQPIIITRSSNNFGPHQFPEKVIPLFVTNLIQGKSVPLYGAGKNVRDWLYVQDNCEAIDLVLHNGVPGEIYNIGGGNELTNKELTMRVLRLMGKDESFISYVEDRKGHDLRYSLDIKKLQSLGWKPRFDFDSALYQTIEWYKNNPDWWVPLKSILGKRTS